MSYVGLVPSESTTGQQRRLGAITKTGSGHARRLLVEAAWHYRHGPAIGKTLTERQDGQPAQAIAIAWSAQQRLHRTWTRLEAARQAPHDHRRRRRPRARRLLLGDHPHRIDLAPDTPTIPSAGSVAARQRAGNPRLSYEQPAPTRGWPRPILDSGARPLVFAVHCCVIDATARRPGRRFVRRHGHGCGVVAVRSRGGVLLSRVGEGKEAQGAAAASAAMGR